MECVIPGANIKVWSKAIQALSRIGDELHMEPKGDYLLLKAANMTTTAYCTFKFHETFFSSYDVEDVAKSDGLGCVMPMKGVLGVFKLHSHKDKRPEICKIELEHNPSRIVFKLKYKHDVLVVRCLYLNDNETVNVNYTTSTSNQISANSQLFMQILSNFHLGDDDMGVEVTANSALVRNYIAGDTNKMKGIRSQITLTAGEFNSFRIEQETCITYSLKPFRAAVNFAEAFNINITINFDIAGMPAVLVIRSSSLEADFVISTLRSSHASQSTTSSATFARKKLRRNANMTLQDQQALESVNWENNFSDPANDVLGGRSFVDAALDRANGDGSLEVLSTSEKVGDQDEEVIAASPESPHSKKIKTIFGRCYEPTFHRTMLDLGQVLAPDSDTEAD